MIKSTVLKYILIGLPLLFNFAYTIRYSFVVNKNIFLTRRQKIMNLILIWVIPIIWILFLRTFFKPNPGSHQVSNKRDSGSFTESGLGIWNDTPLDASNHH